jgi:hypothetical protein
MNSEKKLINWLDDKLNGKDQAQFETKKTITHLDDGF